MSSLFLIRHGQASFGARDYDVLSELGIEQARRLGSHWAVTGRHLDAIYSGPRKRQIDSARELVDAARNGDAEYPDAIVLDGLDEYPAFDIINHFGPILAANDPELQSLLGGQPNLDRAFDLIMGKWISGELEAPQIESFRHFTARVERGLVHIMGTEGRRKQIAAVTSGGPISVALRMALGLSDETTLRMGSVVANASVSEFRYRDTELTMFGFNEISHLTAKELITYR